MRSELPDGWRVVSVKDIAADGWPIGGPFGSSLGTNDYVSEGVPVIRGENLAGVTFVTPGTVFVSPEKAESLARCLAQPGDIAVTQRGTLGQVGRVPAKPYEHWLVSQSQMILRVDRDHAEPDFVYWCLRSPLFQQQVRDHAIVTGVPHINLGIFGQLTLPLPPLDEQPAIASLLSALDEKIDSNDRTRQCVDATGASLFRLIAGNEVHEQTSVQTLIEQGVILIGDGLRAKNSELGLEGLPFARAGNLNDGFNFATADRVPESLAHRAGAKCSVPGDVVFTSKGTVGRFALVDEWTEPCVYSPQLCFWRSLDHERLPPAVLHWWMQSPIATQQLDALKGQTDMADYVSLRDQRSIVLSLPQPATRQRLATSLEPLAALVGSLRAESRTLAKIRDVLLPKLISGEIRVPDTRDRDAAIGRAADQVAGAKR